MTNSQRALLIAVVYALLESDLPPERRAQLQGLLGEVLQEAAA